MWTARCFNYHYLTGEFVGEEDMFEDPQEPGRYVLPGFATLQPPLPPAAKQAVVFRDDKWQYVADRRGEVWFNGMVPMVVDRLGDPASFEPPLSQKPADGIEQATAANSIATAEIWRRTTHAEADKLHDAMQKAPIRTRKMFDASQSVSTDDELFAELKQIFAGALGPERAAEILAAS